VVQLKQAIDILEQQNLLSFATETVYGLGADATNSDAVLKIYEAKGRPSFNPLICHVADLDIISSYAHMTDLDRLLAQAFWPGPMTLILDLLPNSGLSDLVTAGLKTVGIRIPSNDSALALLKAFGKPVAAPSANISGSISPTTAEHVRSNFGDKIALLDGDDPHIGIESTILRVQADGIIILRHGAITREMVENITGKNCFERNIDEGINAPGQLASHYAPKASVKLNATAVEGDICVIDFAGQLSAQINTHPYKDLSPIGDLNEAAKNLFSTLHEMDKIDKNIIVAPIPMSGIGEGINDRLTRAAAPKDTR